FTAIFNRQLEQKLDPQALILQENSLDDFLTNNQVLFIGDGAKKFKKIITNSNAFFEDFLYNENNIAALSSRIFSEKNFASLAYCEPLYVKEFYSMSISGKP
ncbi:MAG: hypothetical protein ABIY35_01930, partial [Chitinophagaceae bacterium]